MLSGKPPEPAPSLAPIEDITSFESLHCLCGKNSVLYSPDGDQGHADPAPIVNNSEDKTTSPEFFLCRNEYRAQLEKEYAFRHLTERLLEAERGYEAIREEERALSGADLVDVFFPHIQHPHRAMCTAGRGAVASDANAIHAASATRRADTPSWVDGMAVEELA